MNDFKLGTIKFVFSFFFKPKYKNKGFCAEENRLKKIWVLKGGGSHEQNRNRDELRRS